MNSNIANNNNFNQEYKRLNSKQREAVDAIEGPVLVIAGPGTGKTQILAARVGKILLETDTNPQNILCLTFTETAAIAMRKRLSQFIGPDAYKVNIFTFHAFCNQVIQENPELFGRQNIELISELELEILLRELVDSFEKNSPLKRWTGAVYYETGRLKRLFSTMKKEGWTADFIHKKADEYYESLKDRPEFKYKVNITKRNIKAGDVNHKKLAEKKQKMDELKAAASAFDKFNEMMDEKGRYDFDDMINWVVAAFADNEFLLMSYQERYQYFLVDEFQDTSGAQNQILQALINFWDVPNVFTVGDDDQSIFRFQGANLANILEYYENYKAHLKVIVLTDNYRSTQQILDHARNVIERNSERLINDLQELGLNKNLVAKNPDVANLPDKPKVIEYYNTAHEITHITQQIKHLKEKEVSFNDVAIIYRNHSQGEDFARYLERNEIPVNIQKRSNILDSIIIDQILMVLQYLDNEGKTPYSSENLLFQILHFKWFNIEAQIIAQLALDVKKSKKEHASTFRNAIQKARLRIKHTLFDSEGNESYQNMQSLSDNLEYWIKDQFNMTLQTIVEKIITRGGLLEYVLKHPEKTWLMQEISSFFDFVKSERSKNPRMNISDLLKTIDMMRENYIKLEINKTVYAEEGVHLITAHASKGEEFEHVFMIGNTKDVWQSKSKSDFSFPDNLFVKNESDDLQEARRLFYVGMTRAMKSLQISFPASNLDMKETEMSQFVSEFVTYNELELEKISVPEELILEFNKKVLSYREVPAIKINDKEILRKKMESFSLSITSLNSYLKCPVSFYYEKVLNVPQAKNEYLQFGSSIHYALEELFKTMVKNEKKFPSAEELVKYFDWHMKQNVEAFTEIQFKKKLEYGRKILPEYYNNYIESWNKIVTVERAIRKTIINGVEINGKVDKIEFNGKMANVVDYKTGNYERNIKFKKQFNRPGEKITKSTAPHVFEYGGDYWRQAVFYKLLIDTDARQDWTVVSTEFDFIEPHAKSDVFHKEKVLITDEDLEIVAGQIKETNQKIMNLEFDHGCNMEYCRWCKFVKNNFRDLPEPENEEIGQEAQQTSL